MNREHFEKFNFPDKITLKKTIKDCLESVVDDKYYYHNSKIYDRIKNDITKDFSEIFYFTKSSLRTVNSIFSVVSHSSKIGLITSSV